MTAESAKEYKALEAQAANLIAFFSGKGYEHVAPSFIQPASLLLDRIGETLRARTYVFTDPNGEELCLRPDLTLPVCRVFVERGAPDGVAKFCYNGPAFRVQDKPDPLLPREFQQAGIEYFGASTHDADLEVLALTIQAIRDSGVSSFIVKVGHLGLFKALLHAIDMPPRWRDRLERSYWRQTAFSRELEALAKGKAAAKLLPKEALTEGGLLDYLEANGVPFIGRRRAAEIVQRLQDKAADAKEPPLAHETVDLIETYLKTRGDVSASLRAVETLTRAAQLDIGDALEDARALFYGLKALAGPAPIVFEADFGRHFEYYTGMVFQIEIEGTGVAGEIAGGGRYDGLIRALSRGAHDVPAVGAALHTERVLAAASSQR